MKIHPPIMFQQVGHESIWLILTHTGRNWYRAVGEAVDFTWYAHIVGACRWVMVWWNDGRVWQVKQ